MKDNDRTLAIIIKLNRLTSEDLISWKIEDAPRSITRGTDDIISIYLETEYKQSYFAIYERRVKYYNGDRDEFYWSELIVLAMLDAYERVLWETFDHNAALKDLFLAARNNAAEIDHIFDNILNDDE